MRNKKGRYEYHNYKKRRKAKEPNETRADVLAALEQQRKKEAERSPSIEQSSVPKPIPGFLFDQEKQKYFPLSMKRDSVYVGYVRYVEKRTNRFQFQVPLFHTKRVAFHWSQPCCSPSGCEVHRVCQTSTNRFCFLLVILPSFSRLPTVLSMECL